MCGFLFFFEQGLAQDEFTQRLSRGMDKLTHRGPDDEGVAGAFNWRMGHRRLSIIDIETSMQPMPDPEKRYWLAFNGEIYNYKKLRDNLKKQWQFRTNGDTEVILAGMITQGESFIKKMEGMWAFALWDDKDKKLFLSRDRIGKKPLYYQAGDSFFSCASELPTLSCLSNQSWDDDPDSLADYLRYGYYLPGYTAYKNVFEVLPGHNLAWTPSRGITQSQYWQLGLSKTNSNQAEVLSRLRTQLKEAVTKRLVADVEVGAFLSGGVDSSLIVGLMKEIGHTPKTFTIGFDSKSYDERIYASQVANFFETDHKEKLLGNWDIESLKKLVFEHIGQPFADSSLLPTALVSDLASQYVKVALSGDGGDELFSGYQRYHARSLMRIYSRIPKLAQKGFSNFIRSLPEPLAHHSHSILKKAHLFLDITERDSGQAYISPTLYSEKEFMCLAPTLKNHGHNFDLPTEPENEDDIMQLMLADALVYLPQDILVKTDRASMAHSLEVRAPFLDHKLIETAFSMPAKWHRNMFGGKIALRKACSKILPSSIWNRRKQGFAVPVNDWFRQDLLPEIKDLLLQSDSAINTNYVQELLQQHVSGNRDNGYRLWNIFIFLLWQNKRLHGYTG